MKTFILLMLVAGFTSGCTIFDSYQTKAAGEIANGIKAYCEETTVSIREGLRDEVNKQAAPNSITITCG